MMSSSVKTALIILAIVVLYFGASMMFRQSAQTADNGQAAESAEQLFSVSTTIITPQTWRDEIIIRGRSEALRKVVVRAETSGVVAQTPATLGALVKKGDVLCRLNIDARRASLNEARAALAKARLDHDAARSLAKDGFRSDTSVASAKAALDLARAGVEQAQLNVNKINIAAPFDGVFDQRMIEIGDFLNVGDPCGVVIQQAPFLVTGSVSEQDVSKVKTGDVGVARFSTGETIDGKVRFVAAAADPSTRTFRVELEIPNDDGALKDGVTADFTVYAARRDAHLAPRSALTLDDKGRIGVRIVDQDNIVHVQNIRLLGEGAEGVWIDGLEGAITLITRGQQYVTEGQKVLITRKGEGEDA